MVGRNITQGRGLESLKGRYNCGSHGINGINFVGTVHELVNWIRLTEAIVDGGLL